jgi:hypothetical protein
MGFWVAALGTLLAADCVGGKKRQGVSVRQLGADRIGPHVVDWFEGGEMTTVCGGDRRTRCLWHSLGDVDLDYFLINFSVAADLLLHLRIPVGRTEPTEGVRRRWLPTRIKRSSMLA